MLYIGLFSQLFFCFNQPNHSDRLSQSVLYIGFCFFCFVFVSFFLFVFRFLSRGLLRSLLSLARFSSRSVMLLSQLFTILVTAIIAYYAPAAVHKGNALIAHVTVRAVSLLPK